MTTASHRTRILRRWVIALFMAGGVWGIVAGDDMSYSDPVRWIVGIPLTGLFLGTLIAFRVSRGRDRQIV